MSPTQFIAAVDTAVIDKSGQRVIVRAGQPMPIDLTDVVRAQLAGINAIVEAPVSTPEPAAKSAGKPSKG